jgi:hypothetical protein
VSIEGSINLMERMGMLPPEKKLRRNIFEHHETIGEIIEEGIFRSYSAEKILDILERHYTIQRDNQLPKTDSEITIEFDAYKDTPMTYGTEEASVITIIVKRGTEEEKLKHFFNTCGWPVAEEYNHETDKTLVVITFEKRRQEDELPVPNFLYHLTPENKVNKILKNGLVPKAQNKLGEHPDRIYFFLQKDLTLNYKSYADDFWASGHKKETRDVKYALLKIDTKKCQNDFKIYGDPNMIRGVWTFNNVPPEAITIEEEGI